MKKKSLLTSLLLIIGLGSYTVLNTSYSSGFGSYSNTTCVTCHSGSAPTTAIAINGLPTYYTHGQSYPLSVTVTNSSKLVAGFQIRSNIGTITNSDPGISNYPDGRSAGHNTPKGMISGVSTFNVMWTAPATGSTIANFGAQGIGANGTGNTNGDSGAFITISNIALPVLFVNVNAIAREDHIQLNFETAEEKNIQSFEIERRKENTDFKSIQLIQPKGNGNYISNDFEIEKNTNYYYRIKETDLDNKTTYSEIVSAKISGENDLNIYPTISNNQTFTIKGLNEYTNVKAVLYNMLGAPVVSSLVNNGIFSIEKQLPHGNYIIQLIDNKESVLIKKVIMK